MAGTGNTTRTVIEAVRDLADLGIEVSASQVAAAAKEAGLPTSGLTPEEYDRLLEIFAPSEPESRGAIGAISDAMLQQADKVAKVQAAQFVPVVLNRVGYLLGNYDPDELSRMAADAVGGEGLQTSAGLDFLSQAAIATTNRADATAPTLSQLPSSNRRALAGSTVSETGSQPPSNGNGGK